MSELDRNKRSHGFGVKMTYREGADKWATRTCQAENWFSPESVAKTQ